MLKGVARKRLEEIRSLLDDAGWDTEVRGDTCDGAALVAYKRGARYSVSWSRDPDTNRMTFAIAGGAYRDSAGHFSTCLPVYTYPKALDLARFLVEEVKG